MIVQFLLLIITLAGTHGLSHIRHISAELGSTDFFRCEIAQLSSNAVITWVYRPKVPTIHGIKWLPLYANARRLTQNNQRFIVDHSGFNEQTKTHVSILTLQQLNLSDEGIYMCKSNQLQSTVNLFNLTLLPSMKIDPEAGIIELDHSQKSINLTCTVRELTNEPIDPLRLNWYHRKHGVNQHLHSHLIRKSDQQNQAAVVLSLHRLPLKDSGPFRCVYDDGKISKDVYLSYPSSVLGYSKSTSTRLFTSSCLSLGFIQMISFIAR